MNNCLIPLVAVSALAVSSASAAITYSDSFSSDTLSNYTVTQGATAGVSYSATAGVGSPASGGLSIAGNSGDEFLNSIIYKTGFTLETGSENSLQMSVFVKRTGAFSGSSNFFLGISNDPALSWGGGTAGGAGAIGVVLTGSNEIGTRAYNAGTGSTGNQVGGATYVTDNWYKVSATITKPTSGNNWTVSGSLQDWGSNGTTPGTTLTLPSSTVTLANTTFNDAATLNYAQFGTRKQNFTAADNFTLATIPEPSTLVSLLGGVGILGLRRRRKS